MLHYGNEKNGVKEATFFGLQTATLYVAKLFFRDN